MPGVFLPPAGRARSLAERIKAIHGEGMKRINEALAPPDQDAGARLEEMLPEFQALLGKLHEPPAGWRLTADTEDELAEIIAVSFYMLPRLGMAVMESRLREKWKEF